MHVVIAGGHGKLGLRPPALLDSPGTAGKVLEPSESDVLDAVTAAA